MSIGKISLVIEASNIDEIMNMLKVLNKKEDFNLPLPIEIQSGTKVNVKKEKNIKENKDLDNNSKIENEKKPTYKSKDEVTNVLQSLISSKGYDVAKEVLAEYGYIKVSDISPEKYDEIIKACTEKLA